MLYNFYIDYYDDLEFEQKVYKVFEEENKEFIAEK